MTDQPSLHDRPIFTAQLRPHRSLNQTGFLALMGALAAISFIAGIAFLLLGAWPVVGFFGFDVLIVYWAFRINYARAAAVEEITVTPLEVRVRRVSHRGQISEFSYNPLWVRLDIDSHEEFGVERLMLVSRGKRLAIGRFLGAAEKQSFAEALRAALQAARRGPDYNPV